MLREAKELQEKAVKSLVKCVLSQKNTVFKAPTGSGKTYMMADLINRLLVNKELLKGKPVYIKDVVFLVSSLSKGELAKQNYEKFCEYSEKKFFSHIDPYLINSDVLGEERLFIPNNHNVYFLPRDLYKKNSKLMQGPMIEFLLNLTNLPYQGGLGKLIVLIKDECHIATSNLDALESFFDKIISFSATPKMSRGQRPSVEISEEEAVNTKLIKHIEWQDEEETIFTAVKKFEEVKKDYLNLLGINPCLIIQISNKDKAKEELEEIFQVLKDKQNLKWALIVDSEKECDTNDFFKEKKLSVSKWKDYMKKNLSTIDIIIFKMVITEGWDIPRACMLYQMRDSKSKQLDEQVLGRVRRNSKLLDFENLKEEQQKLALKAWVWGIKKEEEKHWYSVKLQGKNESIWESIKIKTTRLNLKEKKIFNIKKFLEEEKKKENIINDSSSIFDLGCKVAKLDIYLQNIIFSNISSYQDWFLLAEKADVIKKKYEEYICDYEQSLEVEQENGQDKEISFPAESSYLDGLEKQNYLSIANCIWKRSDGKNRFYFDSEAETKWAEILKSLTEKENVAPITISEKNLLEESKEIYLWGKNYIPNSNIKFEYYLDGVHSSYPDFIMKDKKGQIHIFEVKSLNSSNNFNIDREEYEIKIKELKKSYKFASKLTKQIFYLPIIKQDKWTIIRYKNGEESQLKINEFKSELVCN